MTFRRIVVLVVVPAIAALILGHNPVAVADMIEEGVKTTTNNGILFIFSVIYFGVLSDTGLFDIIVDWLVKKHAPAALIISATLFAAGAMVGVFDGTGMLTEMAGAIMNIIPAALGKYIHVIFGFLVLPLGLCVGTDAYFYGIMPLVMQVGETYGVASLSTAVAMIIGKNLALMVSPLVPATFLAIGLTGTELRLG